MVGVRSTRRTDHPGHVTVADCEHGGWIHLANWPWEPLTLARVERGERTFCSVASQLLPGDSVAREGGRRWAIESFFKEAKHSFGLNRCALRTAQGLDRWVLLVFAALLCRHTVPGTSGGGRCPGGPPPAGCAATRCTTLAGGRIPAPARLFTHPTQVQDLSPTSGVPTTNRCWASNA
ncbi:hypothetical protein HNQ10_002575 [Deinococcus metallilatus]|uniref:Transposase IS4-like domain-containing protein n=1 Tax=Deinococcus metallilatus TaxID=1211322 RepID=A0ABR6MWW4_9DEIO|nr:hypothetical protein [Deinococcus metallilatus]